MCNEEETESKIKKERKKMKKIEIFMLHFLDLVKG